MRLIRDAYVIAEKILMLLHFWLAYKVDLFSVEKDKFSEFSAIQIFLLIL